MKTSGMQNWFQELTGTIVNQGPQFPPRQRNAADNKERGVSQGRSASGFPIVLDIPENQAFGADGNYATGRYSERLPSASCPFAR